MGKKKPLMENDDNHILFFFFVIFGLASLLLRQLDVGRRRELLPEELDDVEREAGDGRDHHRLPPEVRRPDELGVLTTTTTTKNWLGHLRGSKNPFFSLKKKGFFFFL